MKPSDMTWVRFVRKRTAYYTGMHGFFRDVKPAIANISIANITLSRGNSTYGEWIMNEK